MQSRFFPLVLAAFAVVGCERPAQVSRHTISQSLKGVLVYPRSSLVSMASGDSAGQLSLSSPDAPDSVASWQPDGSILIYAERAAQPLWISIQAASGAAGSSYTVTGAIAGSADSTARADSTQRSGSSMSSKRIHRR
jgi:hypothetical protein